jgi:hypothetical protein
MKKLSLSVETLTVESFTTDAAGGPRGTVEGRSGTTYADESCNGTCNGTCYPASCMSCAITCDQTCGTCGGTCAAYTCGGNTCQGTCDYATCAQPETCWMNIC